MQDARPRKRSRAAVLRRLGAAACVCLGLGALGPVGCGGEGGPCLVFIVVDTTRRDALGCYGNAQAATATLDSLARVGVRFDQAVTHVPVTAPSITTILAGVLPPTHGVRDNGRFVVNPELKLLPEIFREAGYRTAGVAAVVPLLGRFGYARGCEAWDDDFAADPYPVHDPRLADQAADLRRSERRAAAVTDRALDWLGGTPRREPVFLFVHYFDPHHPYDAPPEFTARHPGRPYDAEVAYMDGQIGRLLDGVRRHRGGGTDIRVVVVGDHGESLGQHDEADHGFFVYDSTLRVPLIFSGGDVQAGLVVRAQVRTVDLAATVCRWLGLMPGWTQGVSLVPVLHGGAVPAACDTAVVETFLTQLQYDWAPLMGLRTAAWKWVRAPRPELYDLAGDPGELRNLVDDRADVAAAYAAAHDRIVAEAEARGSRWGAAPAAADPDLERRLRSLGYMAGQGGREVRPDWSLPDPKDGNRRFNERQARQAYLARGSALLRGGDVAGALAQVEAAAGIAPLQGREAAFQAYLLTQLGRYGEALPAHRASLRGQDDPAATAQARLALARTLYLLDDRSAAAAQLDTLESGPPPPPDVAAGVAELRGLLAAPRE